jgi:putative ABC transport system substrate-binding protein
VKRREFITLLGGAVAWPLAARAQQPATSMIGFLSSAAPGPYAPFASAFNEGLKEASYFEGQNVTVEYRWTAGQDDRMPALARLSAPAPHRRLAHALPDGVHCLVIAEDVASQ